MDQPRLAAHRHPPATTAGSLPAASDAAAVDARDQARWILQGRACSRIVVEDLDDVAVFKAVTDRPVVHLAELADDGHG